MSKTVYCIFTTICIVISVGLILGSVQLGFQRAATGEDALVWLHMGAFVVVITLVLATVIARAKIKK